MKKAIFVLLLLLTLWRPATIIYSRTDAFFGRTYHARYNDLKKLYYSSQYMIKKNPVIIPDEALEAFAGGIFLKGLNPILIIHDQPPLGRYLTSLSILLFDNESTLIILWFSLSLLGLFLISRKLYKNYVYALVPVALFANEPLMTIKLVTTPLLEIIQLPFIIFGIYFFLKMIEHKKLNRFTIFTSLTLGVVISTRYFVLGGAELLSFFVFLISKKRFHDLFLFVATLPLALVVLELSYFKTIQESRSIIKPLSVQKYIFSYQSSKFTQIGTVWDLLIFNRWHTWWGSKSITTDSNWLITWPISAFLTLVLFLLGIFKKIKLEDGELVLILWVITYGLMLSAGAVSTRYFLPWIPFFYILAFSLLFRVKFIKNIFK